MLERILVVDGEAKQQVSYAVHEASYNIENIDLTIFSPDDSIIEKLEQNKPQIVVISGCATGQYLKVVLNQKNRNYAVIVWDFDCFGFEVKQNPITGEDINMCEGKARQKLNDSLKDSGVDEIMGGVFDPDTILEILENTYNDKFKDSDNTK